MFGARKLVGGMVSEPVAVDEVRVLAGLVDLHRARQERLPAVGRALEEQVRVDGVVAVLGDEPDVQRRRSSRPPGSLNWLAEAPVPLPPGLSGWIAVCDQVESAGFSVGIESV